MIINGVETDETRDEGLMEQPVQVIEPETDSIKRLSQTEIQRMLINQLEREKIDANISLIRANVTILNLQKEKLVLQNRIFDNDIYLLENETNSMNNAKQSIKNNYIDIIQKITSKYDLKSSWGFNPDTGEITTNIPEGDK